MRDDRIDPSAISEFRCPQCNQTFLAYFLYLRHAREKHGDRPAPLSPEANAKQEGTG